jgi:dTDP-glucose pyrophosphorylase
MKDITIQSNATIKEAMEALSQTAEKVLLVVDANQRLIGCLTDGDIRRYILKGMDLSGTIKSAYNKNPVFVFREEGNQEKIKDIILKNKLELLPILDENRIVVEYVSWRKAFGSDRKVKDPKLDIPVVIMAGGKGTRLEPFTKVLPKPLIPVGEKPVIDHIIDRFRKYDISKFYLTIHHMSKILRAYFEEKKPDYSIDFAEEDEPRGTAGSLKLLKENLDGPFFVSNCDIIIDADYLGIYDLHKNNGYDITLVAATKQFDIPYGICELNGDGSLNRIMEKPEYSFLVNTGLYILNHETLKLIPDSGLFHITDLIDKVKRNNGSIGVYPISEKSWIDVGQWAEYKKALKIIEGI